MAAAITSIIPLVPPLRLVVKWSGRIGGNDKESAAHKAARTERNHNGHI